MKKYKVGYTQGCFDLFHVGHLNILKNAKEYCETLVVGINSDELIKTYKKNAPIINQNDRLAIVESVRYVDSVMVVDTLDKIEIRKFVDFDVIFVGSDWVDNERWKRTKYDLELLGVDTVFLPHTDGISSSQIKETISKTENKR